MNIKVRDYVRLEMSRLPEVNKNRIDMSGFDYVYRLFEQILDLDIGNRELDGLREQLSESIERIICTKIDRSDINVLFPNVWGNYESYIRKIVYILDEDKYNELKQEKATFESYLVYLDIDSSEPDAGKRTPESECFYRAKQLRNNDSHECPIMSVRECYENLIYSIAAMYLATKKAYIKLHNNSERLTSQIDFAPVKSQVIKTDSLLSIGFLEIGDIFRLSDYGQNFKEIYIKGVHYYNHYTFDKNRKLIRATTTFDNNTNKYNYTYTKKGNTVEVIKQCEETEEEYVDTICTYNDIGALTQKQDYVLKKGNYVLYSTTFFDYLTDGGVVIREVRDGSLLGVRLQFNNKGLLVYKSIPFSSPSTYVYNETGILSKIYREDGTEIEVNQINNFLQFTSIDKNGERVREQSWKLNNGKIQRIDYYESDATTKKIIVFKYF